MPLTPKELRDKILKHVAVEESSTTSWEGNAELEDYHSSRMLEAKELLEEINLGIDMNEARDKVVCHIKTESAAMEKWKDNPIICNDHKARCMMAQEILTMIDSGGANSL